MKSEKITERSATEVDSLSRWYQDACGAAHGLELVGERWSLLVIRELMLGPRRFNDLKGSLTGISANTLQQRLETLEAHGILLQRRLPTVNVKVYELTAWGCEAEPIFQVLGRWAARSPTHDPRLPFSLASLVLSLRTMFDPERAGPTKARVALVVGDDVIVARVKKERIAIARGEAAGADVTVSGQPAALAALVYGGVALAVLEGEGALAVSGDRDVLRRFVTMFPLPPKAPIPVRQQT